MKKTDTIIKKVILNIFQSSNGILRWSSVFSFILKITNAFDRK